MSALPLMILAQIQPQPPAGSEQQLAVSAVLAPTGVPVDSGWHLPPPPDLAPVWPEQVRDKTHTQTAGGRRAHAQRREALTRPTVYR